MTTTTSASRAVPDRATEDARREAELSAYEAITRQPRRELRALTELAAIVTQVPMATINLITATQQHQVAAHGFDAGICSREDSMCAAVLHEPEPVVVADARLDPRFHTNPFVTGELGDVRFYAAHHLITPEGIAIGTLCVFDTEPRELDQHQRLSLQTLADRIVDVLELDRRTRQLTATLERMHRVQHELERSNQQLAAFAGQVSHDLRNPLTAVGMALSLLREELDDLASGETDTLGQASWLATRAISATDRMRELVDGLLDFARIGGDLRRTEVDLQRVVADVVADLEAPLASADVSVGELPTVSGDRTQLRALLQNLVANAAKFVPEGATPVVEVRARRLDGGWRVEVADRGIGVAEVDRDRVFEPLTRVDTRVEGSGIGLATCKRVVEAHGGQIGLVPREGGGTVVWFELPDDAGAPA